MSFAFVPPTGLNDVTHFPSKDILIRKHIQDLLQQIPDYYEDLPSSIGANGYLTLSKGLIIQWGNDTISAATGNSKKVTFPKPFPVSCVYFSPVSNGGINNVYGDGKSNDSVYAWKTSTGDVLFSWFAIGY